jgi:hypothetical protein
MHLMKVVNNWIFKLIYRPIQLQLLVRLKYIVANWIFKIGFRGFFFFFPADLKQFLHKKLKHLFPLVLLRLLATIAMVIGLNWHFLSENPCDCWHFLTCENYGQKLLSNFNDKVLLLKNWFTKPRHAPLTCQHDVQTDNALQRFFKCLAKRCSIFKLISCGFIKSVLLLLIGNMSRNNENQGIPNPLPKCISISCGFLSSF